MVWQRRYRRDMEINEPVPVIVGEAVAGEATKVKKQIVALIKNLNSSTFDLAEALHTVKAKNFYSSWGHETFTGYLKTLDLKTSRGYYLCKIVESMLIAGVPREVYEPVGIAKLRVITALDPTGEFEGKSNTTYIKSLIEVAKETEIETLKEAVAHLKGQVGEEARTWLNIGVSKSQKAVIDKAIELIRKSIGTVGQDADGMAKDSSDGRCLELMAAAILADPEYNPTPEQ